MFLKHFLLNSSLHTFSHTVSFLSQIKIILKGFFNIINSHWNYFLACNEYILIVLADGTYCMLLVHSDYH